MKIGKKNIKKIKNIPAYETGFENKYYNVSEDEFKNKVISKLLANSEGKELENGYVPNTYFFLWNDDKIVGLFKIRHYLNEHLIKGAGHLGYAILAEHRQKGYATRGLKLAIEKCKNIIKEDEIYMSVYKDNIASLKVMLSNGAYIVDETDNEYLTRIKI